jgi:SAM-dependent methyltransferase
MANERDHHLEPDILELFAGKGTQLFSYNSLAPGSAIPQVGEINAVKVRRVLQMLKDFARGPLETLRVFDFGCAEGVYAIETALRGARVHAFDARTERLEQGRAIAERLGLDGLTFEQADIRAIDATTHGDADVVFLLGILYHLGSEDLFKVLKNVRALCRQFVIIETWVAVDAKDCIEYEGDSYRGTLVREHHDSDPQAVRAGRLLASIDNSHSFRPTREALFRALGNCGYTSVCECHLPAYPGMPEDRVTLVACTSEPVRLSSYPWLNELDEAAIAKRLEAYASQLQAQWSGGDSPGGER